MKLQNALGNRGVSRLIQAKFAVGRTTDAAEREAESRSREMIDGHAEPFDASPIIRRPVEIPDSNQNLLNPQNFIAMLGAGQSLESAEQTYFGTRLGQDLGSVRVHSEDQAGRAANALRAQAFTVGNHIAFAPGRYSPSTVAGRRLLAHELTHVAQQSGSTGSGAALEILQRRPQEDSSPEFTPTTQPTTRIGRVRRQPSAR